MVEQADRRLFIFLSLLIALSFAASVQLSSSKLFWEDELFQFYSDARPTLFAVVEGQRHFPFSLEPPAFHLLLHIAQHLPFRPEISTRLPSAIALVITQLSAFFLVRSLTRNRVLALTAALLPLVLATFDYSAEARVYSLLTACYALSFVFYLRATSFTLGRQGIAKVCLFFSLSGCVLLHYYGLFLPLPFLIAEGILVLKERNIRWSTLVAILASFALFSLNLPFLAGLREIQAKYYDSGEARWDMAPLTYVWVVFRVKIYNLRQQTGIRANVVPLVAVCFVAGALVFLWRRYRRLSTDSSTKPVLLALACGMLVPLVNLLVGIYHSHAYTPRYSLPVVLPIVVTVMLMAERIARLRHMSELILVGVMLVALHEVRDQIHQTNLQSKAFLATLVAPTFLSPFPYSLQDQHIYVQDLATFLPLHYYASQDLKRRLVEVQSIPVEYNWEHSATTSLFAKNMAASTSLPVITYKCLESMTGPHLLLASPKGDDWMVRDLSAQHWIARGLGPAFGGDLFIFTAP